MRTVTVAETEADAGVDSDEIVSPKLTKIASSSSNLMNADLMTQSQQQFHSIKE